MSDSRLSSGRFDDGKAEAAMRTIGEVSAAFNIKQHVLRYWEQQFPMLRPLKRSGGRRLYRAEDVALVERIDALVNGKGYTLKGARQEIENGSAAATAPAPASAGSPPEPTLRETRASELMARLHAIRERLAQAIDA